MRPLAATCRACSSSACTSTLAADKCKSSDTTRRGPGTDSSLEASEFRCDSPFIFGSGINQALPATDVARRPSRGALDDRWNRAVQHTAHGSEQLGLLRSDDPVGHYRCHDGGNKGGLVIAFEPVDYRPHLFEREDTLDWQERNPCLGVCDGDPRLECRSREPWVAVTGLRQHSDEAGDGVLGAGQALTPALPRRS